MLKFHPDSCSQIRITVMFIFSFCLIFSSRLCAFCLSEECVCRRTEFKNEEGQEGTGGCCGGKWRHHFWYQTFITAVTHVWNYLTLTTSYISLHFLTAPTKKAKNAKEPEAPVLYEDPPDQMTSKDGRQANMKITSWNVDGLRAWVKKNGLDVSWRCSSVVCPSPHQPINGRVPLSVSSSGSVRRIQTFSASKKPNVPKRTFPHR